MKVAILGATGMQGHKMYMRLRDDFEVFAIARCTYQSVSKFGIFSQAHFVEQIDVENTPLLIKTLKSIKPDAIINCIGLTLRKISTDRYSQLIKINSVLPNLLHEWCIENNSRLLHYSTDCVFSGDKGSYTEEDSPDARDHYGLSKVLGEVEGPNALTIRSSIVGLEILHKTELLEWFISQKQKSIKGFSEVYYSGVTTGYMAEFTKLLLKDYPDLSGIFQLSSERISKYDLLQKVNVALDLKVQISPDMTKKSDKSLDSTRLFSLVKKAEKPNWNRMIEEIKMEYPQYQRWAKL